MRDLTPYIFELMKEVKSIHSSKGFAYLQKIYRFRMSFGIYSENKRVFFHAVTKYYSDLNLISDNSVKRWRKQRNINKDIHNLISSSNAYIEHVSKMNPNFQLVLDKIQKDIKDKSIYHFIRALRNFLLHIEPMALVSRAVWTKDNPKQVVRFESIDKISFEKYLEGRTKDSNKTHDVTALKYLKELQDEININCILNEFDELICTFHEWFILIYVKENLADLQNLYHRVDALHHESVENGFNQENPITRAQLKHLHMLISKSKAVFG